MATEQEHAARERKFARDRVQRQADQVAAKLRSLAERVEMETRGYLKDDQFDRLGQTVVHEVTWGVANLNLSTLLDATSGATETYRRTGEVGHPVPDAADLIAALAGDLTVQEIAEDGGMGHEGGAEWLAQTMVGILAPVLGLPVRGGEPA